VTAHDTRPVRLARHSARGALSTTMSARRQAVSNEKTIHACAVGWQQVFCSDIGVLIKPTEVTWLKDQVGRYSASGALVGRAAHKPKYEGVDAS
jgi:hypothetical protein